MNPPARRPSHHLAAVWFADIAGYTRLSSENEQAALALVRALQDAARRVVPQHDGRIVKFIGDAVLAEFPSTHAAVGAAAALRDACAVSPGTGGPSGPELRIGVHVGDVVAAPDGDVYGDGVNIAARLQQAAEPRQVVVSEDVWRQLRQRPEFQFTGLGERELRGMAPLVIYAVQIEPGTAHDAGPLSRPAAGFLYRRHTLVLAGLAFLVVLAAVGLLTRDRTPAKPPPVPSEPLPSGGEPSSSSIVVLPFDDMSPGGDNEYFSDGMTEELINALVKVEGLRVASRTSAFAFKGKDLDVREIGSRLKVATVLEGSVRKEGNRLRITAQLVNAADGYHLWSETYDRELEDVFEIQEQIARAIVGALRVELASGSPVVSPASRTRNLEAYNLYLKGRYFWKRRGEGDLDAAIRYFNESIAEDPAFAPAYSGIADTYNILWLWKPVAPSETYRRARAAALKALEIDSTLAEAHASLAQVKAFHDFDWEGSEREFRQALDLDPGYVPGRTWYALFLLTQDRVDEALVQASRAEELDPLWPASYSMQGRALYYKREYDRAIEYFGRALELNPRSRGTYALRGSAYFRNGEHAKAMADFAKAAELAGFPGGDVQAGTGEGLAYVQAVTGLQAEARRRLAELERLAETTYVSPGAIAVIHIGLGENEEALDWLERSYETRDGWLHWLKVHPVFDPLRSEPRFRRLQEKVGLR
jgi:adenylate cyclase